jgi:RimJ/RimL family protein N-acetyltransferase
MGWQFTDDVEQYAAAVLPLLSADPASHTIGLTVVENARRRATPLPEPEMFGWWSQPDGRVSGAVSVTPPYPLLLEVAPEETLRALVTTLGPRLTGANGPLGTVTQLAALWAAQTGGSPRLVLASRLFRLAELLRPVPGPAGHARPATDSDVELLAAWTRDFDAETPGPQRTESHLAAARDRVGWDGYRLWCTDDGTPVSMAGLTRPAAGSVRIGPVFTPREQRGRGYAAAVTAAASEAARERAGVVVLFTDLANPTSNALYPRIGFRPVADRATFAFDPVS